MTQPPQRIRVAYIVSSLMSGGAELQMLALSERLPRDEFHVDFICMAEPGPEGRIVSSPWWVVEEAWMAVPGDGPSP